MLGSGLGDFAGTLGDGGVDAVRRAAALAGVARSSATPAGWWSARSGTRRSRRWPGRCHVYEGHDLQTVTFAVRVLGLLGVKTLILTNAAGGINTGFSQGALMVIDDHINLIGGNPLVGDNDERFGARFPDMTEVYSPRLRRLADEAGRRRAGRCRTASTRRCSGRATRRRPRSAICGRSAPTPSACRPCRRRSSRGTWGSRCSASRASPTWPPACCRSRSTRRGDGDRAPGPRPVHRAAGGDHWPALSSRSRRRPVEPSATRARLPLRSSRRRERHGSMPSRRFPDSRSAPRSKTADGTVDHRLQHRERHLRPDDLRRAGGDVQGAVGGAPPVHPDRDRRRHRRADAAVRRVPPDSVGVRRRPRGDRSPT